MKDKVGGVERSATIQEQVQSGGFGGPGAEAPFGTTSSFGKCEEQTNGNLDKLPFES